MEVKPAEFARMAGVSRQSVSEKIKSKTLILNAAGMLDTENPVNSAYLENRRRKVKENAETAGIYQRKKHTLAVKNSTDPQDWDEDQIASAAGVPKELLGMTLKQIVMHYGGLLGLEKHAKILRDTMVSAEKELKMQERSLALIKKDFVISRLFQYLNVLMKQLLEYPESSVDEIMALVKSQGDEARPQIIALLKQGLGMVIADSKDHIVKELQGLKEKYSSSEDNLEKIKEVIAHVDAD